MGTFAGHALPGTFFIIFGIWWAIKHSYRHFKVSHRKLARRRCFNIDVIEGIVKIACGSIGFLLEQVTNRGPWFHLTNQENPSSFLDSNNWSHCTMYMFFIFSGITDLLMIFFPRLMLQGVQHLILALAFLIEGYLFYFHTHGRMKLDVRLHKLLLLAIWTSALALVFLCVLEGSKPAAPNEELDMQGNGSYALIEDATATTQALLDEETEFYNSKNLGKSEANDHNTTTQFKELLQLLKKSDSIRTTNKNLPTILLLVTTVSTILQGTWFWQIAFILYPPSGKPWDRTSETNIEFATFFFTWHLASAITFVSVVYFLSYRFTRRCI